MAHKVGAAIANWREASYRAYLRRRAGSKYPCTKDELRRLAAAYAGPVQAIPPGASSFEPNGFPSERPEYSTAPKQLRRSVRVSS